MAELQRRLGRLGFDAGRVDGIFGPLTARALDDFQRNVGLPPDGICGYETVHALQRLGDRMTGPSIATVREAEQLRRAPRTLAGPPHRRRPARRPRHRAPAPWPRRCGAPAPP